MNKTITFSTWLMDALIQRAIELAFLYGTNYEPNNDHARIPDEDRDEIMSELHDYLPEAEKIAKEKAE